MAYKEFENRRALFINGALDSTEIPNICAAVVRGTVAVSSTGTRLYDPAVNFIEAGIEPGDIVYCYGTHQYATILTVTSSYIDLDPGDIIFVDLEEYFISKKGSNRGCLLYVGAGGSGTTTSVCPAGDPDQVVDFIEFPTGSVLPLQIVKITKASTSSKFIALW